MLICEHAYHKNRDRRQKIMCEVSDLPCAHSYFCQLVMKYRQLDSAKNCPGREEQRER